MESWFMRIGNSEEEQILYFIEKPRGKFMPGIPKPSFTPITIEVPTRMMPRTGDWLQNDETSDLTFEYKIRNGKPKDSFTILDADKINISTRRSRVNDQTIFAITLSYKGVKNAFL